MVGPEAGDRGAVGTPALSNTQRPILTDLTIAEENRRSLFECSTAVCVHQSERPSATTTSEPMD